MKTFWPIQNGFRGIVCGAFGGSIAGAIFGFVYAILGNVLAASIAYFLTGALVGGIVGGFIGGLVGLTLSVTRPFLKRLFEVTGVLTVTLVSFALPFSVEIGWGTWILSAIIIGVFVGYFGGIVAFRCYIWLYE